MNLEDLIFTQTVSTLDVCEAVPTPAKPPAPKPKPQKQPMDFDPEEVEPKLGPTPEELAECAVPQYTKEPSPPTPAQLRAREEAHARFLQLKQANQRELDIGEAISSGKYEVP